MCKLFLSLIALVFLTSCAMSPLGRKQLIFVPDAQMSQLGEQAFSQIKQEMKVYESETSNQWVQCVSKAILGVVEGTDISEWEILVFDDESANAFALPGKKIGIHTGLFQVAQTDGQLATVIAHEIAHVLARHPHERISEALALQGGLGVAGAILNTDGPKRDVLMAALGLGAQFGVVLPHSRRQESESDTIGLQLMAEAGFDPEEAIALWLNMHELSASRAPEFLSTHPSPSTRIKNLERKLPAARKLMEQARSQGRHPNCLPTN
jgi:predicted Zn-dependent protease